MGVHGRSFRYFWTISPWSLMSTNVLYGFFFGCSSCCSPVREKTSGCDCNVIVWFVAVRLFDEEEGKTRSKVWCTCYKRTRDDNYDDNKRMRDSFLSALKIKHHTIGTIPPQTPACAVCIWLMRPMNIACEWVKWVKLKVRKEHNEETRV